MFLFCSCAAAASGGYCRRPGRRIAAAAGAGLLAAGLLAAVPAQAIEPPDARSVAVAAATYGSLYGMAVVASSVAATAMIGLVPPAQLPVAMTFGMPLVMVAVMSNGVPWAVVTVPPWASAQWDLWIGPPAGAPGPVSAIPVQASCPP